MISKLQKNFNTIYYLCIYTQASTIQQIIIIRIQEQMNKEKQLLSSEQTTFKDSIQHSNNSSNNINNINNININNNNINPKQSKKQHLKHLKHLNNHHSHMSKQLIFSTLDIPTTYLTFNKKKLYFTINSQQTFLSLKQQYIKFTQKSNLNQLNNFNVQQHASSSSCSWSQNLKGSQQKSQSIVEFNINGLIVQDSFKIKSIIQSQSDKAMFERLLNNRSEQYFVLKKCDEVLFNTIIWRIMKQIKQSDIEKSPNKQKSPNKISFQNYNYQIQQIKEKTYQYQKEIINDKNQFQNISKQKLYQQLSLPVANNQDSKDSLPIQHHSYYKGNKFAKQTQILQSQYKLLGQNSDLKNKKCLQIIFKEKGQQQQQYLKQSNHISDTQKHYGQKSVKNGVKSSQNKLIYWIDDEPNNNIATIKELKHYGIDVKQITSTNDMIKTLHQQKVKFSSSTKNILFISDMTRKQLGNWNRKAGIQIFKYIYDQMKIKNTGIFYIHDIKNTQQAIKKQKLSSYPIQIVNSQIILLERIYRFFQINQGGLKKF